MPRRPLTLSLSLFSLILLGMVSAQLLMERGAGAQGGSGPVGFSHFRPENMQYLGAFKVPNGPTDQTSFHYGGTAIAYDPTSNGLFMTGHDWYQLSATISIPQLVNSSSVNNLNTAALLQSFADVTDGKISGIDPDSGKGEGGKIGGMLVYNGKLITTAYTYYDGSGNAVSSHFVSGLDLSNGTDAQGPFKVGTVNPGAVGGYMAAVPQGMQSLLGGPAVAGQCCIPIISRSSFGAALFAFDPDTLGVQNPAPATALVYYPNNQQPWNFGEAFDPGTNLFNAVTSINGVFMDDTSQSVIFVGSQGLGTVCYKVAPCTNGGGYGVVPGSGGGPHDYVTGLWVYQASDLAKVKDGTLQPWQVRPFWYQLDLPIAGYSRVGGVAFDPATARLFISQMGPDRGTGFGSSPVVHVYQLNGTPPPRSPTLSITSPRNGETVTDTTVTASFISDKGDDASVDHLHLQLDQTPEVRGLSLVGSHTFQDVPVGQHTIRGYLAYADHSRVPGTDATVNFTTIPPPTNQPPLVSAGPDQTIALPSDTSLNGTVTDDGLPNPPASVTTAWSKVSGPGTVTFGDASIEDTTSSFSLAGTYVLHLTASDSALSSQDDLQVTVSSPSTPELCLSPRPENRIRLGAGDYSGLPTTFTITDPQGLLIYSGIHTPTNKEGEIRITDSTILAKITDTTLYTLTAHPESHRRRKMTLLGSELKTAPCDLFPASPFGFLDESGPITIQHLVRLIQHYRTQTDTQVNRAFLNQRFTLRDLISVIKLYVTKVGQE